MLAPALLLAASLALPASQTEICLSPAPEYCSIGCEDLGAWVVQPFESFEEAIAHLLALDPLERTSAFIAQTPLGHVMIRRERNSDPAPRPDLARAHWRIQEYGQLLTAAAEAHVHGGWIFSTNGSDTAVVRIWFVDCEESSRGRPVRR